MVQLHRADKSSAARWKSGARGYAGKIGQREGDDPKAAIRRRGILFLRKSISRAWCGTQLLVRSGRDEKKSKTAPLNGKGGAAPTILPGEKPALHGRRVGARSYFVAPPPKYAPARKWLCQMRRGCRW